MNIVRYRANGEAHVGVLEDDQVRQAQGEMFDRLQIGPVVGHMDDVELLAPVDPGKLIAIGLNYADHAAESNMPIPKEPILFNKAPTSICGPNDDIVMPVGSTRLDWEVELGFVIGKRAHKVSESEALDHVAGYCICNDVSERSWQLESTGQWMKGKSAPTFGPLGPWLVTSDEIADLGALDMELDVEGERMQTGSTATMIFPVPVLVSYISRYMELAPGDLIITGTPPGVGMGKSPQRFLRAGDMVRASVTGLGEQKQKIVVN
jgi:2-keto-4-pentenoate hydratase/2-oxohepta-3-ene-1,7-dioic acid hydratase in catechol pathway